MATVWLERGDCGLDHFPAACLRCGQPAGSRVLKTFHWMPVWVFATLLLHPFIFLVVALLTRKTQIMRVPMCHDHRRHWQWRTLAVLGGLLLLAAVIVGLSFLIAAAPSGSATLGWAIAAIPISVVVWLAGATFAGLTSVRATAISERGVQLTNVSEAFLAAYRQQQHHPPTVLPDLDRAISQSWADRQAPQTMPPREERMQPEETLDEG